MNFQETINYIDKKYNLNISGQVTIDRSNGYTYVENIKILSTGLNITSMIGADKKDDYEIKLIDIAKNMES